MARYDFNADEVLVMASQIERNGYNFYRSAAAFVDEGDKKQLLLKLADMEVAHEEVFDKLRAELNEQEKMPQVFDPKKEVIEYCKAMADMHVFNDKNLNTSTYENILRNAITAEKDTIAFFLGLKGYVPEGFGRGRIDQIISEEMEHIRLLSKKLAELKQG